MASPMIAAQDNAALQVLRDTLPQSLLINAEPGLDEEAVVEALLETELEYLCKAFESSQHYLRLERKQFRLSHLNEVLETDSPTAGSDVDFMLMTLDGEPKAVRAFFIGRVARSELPAAQIDFGGAERLL